MNESPPVPLLGRRFSVRFHPFLPYWAMGYRPHPRMANAPSPLQSPWPAAGSPRRSAVPQRGRVQAEEDGIAFHRVLQGVHHRRHATVGVGTLTEGAGVASPGNSHARLPIMNLINMEMTKRDYGPAQIETAVHNFRRLIQKYFDSFNPIRRLGWCVIVQVAPTSDRYMVWVLGYPAA